MKIDIGQAMELYKTHLDLTYGSFLDMHASTILICTDRTRFMLGFVDYLDDNDFQVTVDKEI